jgi:hypothetical protein
VIPLQGGIVGLVDFCTVGTGVLSVGGKGSNSGGGTMTRKEEKLDKEAYRLAIKIDAAQQAMEKADKRGNAIAAKKMRTIVHDLEEQAKK